MDKYNVIIESTADSDLRGILRYINETLKEPVTANRIYFSIKEKIESLNNFPQRYPFVRDEVLKLRGLRWMPAENYSVFFVINEAKYNVYILRILYSRREWKNII